jgi:hypothetical protein
VAFLLTEIRRARFSALLGEILDKNYGIEILFRRVGPLCRAHVNKLMETSHVMAPVFSQDTIS